MKKRYLPIILIPLVLTGCAKTDDLYKRNAYNSPVFQENYYTDYDGLTRSVDAGVTPTTVTKVNSFDSYLGKEYNEFRTGILSKLYDGSTICGQRYQLARVQLNENGFATRLPKKLKNVNRFYFAARGGTTCKDENGDDKPIGKFYGFNIKFTLYSTTGHETYLINNCELPVDSIPYYPTTSLYEVTVNNVSELIGYSMEYTCPDFVVGKDGVEAGDELSLMLYEVYLADK